MNTKKCNKCGGIKNVSEFNKKSRNKDLLDTVCRECVNKNRDYTKAKIARKKYYQDNKDAISEKHKKRYYEKMSNPEYRESERKRNRQRYLDNIEKERKRSIAKNKRDSERIKIREKERLQFDENFKLAKNLRRRISKALKKQLVSKDNSYIKLLGCSLDFAKNHIEQQFTKGMTWDNYGLYGWHIDHIKPCSSFDLTDLEQQKECFNYTNLQPLWAEDNLSKGAKYKEII